MMDQVFSPCGREVYSITGYSFILSVGRIRSTIRIGHLADKA